MINKGVELLMEKRKLEDKVALVTGGARGIGLATVEELLKEGANVILTDLESELSELKYELMQKVIIVPLDVSNQTQWGEISKIIDRKFGKLDILVNNAGIGGKEGVTNTTLNQWNEIISVNLTGAFLGINMMLPLLKESVAASIINISSIYGKIGNGEAVAYHAAKSGLIGLTKTIAVELAPHSIRVNTVHPGVINTPMIERKINDPSIKKTLERYTLLPKFGLPVDVAKSISFLASEESGFITGTEIVVDGGYLTH